MALPINIDDLIRQEKVESSRIEYKADWNPEPIVHTITAFANDFDNMGGGYVLIGVEEKNGRPLFPLKGLDPDSIDRIQQEILNKCNLIEPRYIPIIEPYAIDGKALLVLWIPGGEDRPYKCPEKIFTEKGKEKSRRVFYIRKGSRTLKANTSEKRELTSMARDVPFDDRVNYHADVSDLKPSLLASYLYSVESDLYEEAFNRSVEALATDMQLVRGPSEYRKPLNVGLMFFNERPERFFPYAQIEVVDKPDPTGIGMTEKIFRGPLDKQIKDALAFIRNYVLKEFVTKVPDSELAIRAYNWPYQAVEEALCNAVYHKSYQIREPITVTITPEKMEILSVPGPDRSITDENLKKRVLVAKRYRNRRIGDFLKELEIVEGRNTGVPLILKSMKNNGSGAPIFETDEDRSYFLTILPVHPLFTDQKRIIEAPGVQGDSRLRRTGEELRELALNALAEHESMSVSEIADALGYKKASDSLRKVVKEMIESGEIVYLYPDKPNSRKQKVRLNK